MNLVLDEVAVYKVKHVFIVYMEEWIFAKYIIYPFQCLKALVFEKCDLGYDEFKI